MDNEYYVDGVDGLAEDKEEDIENAITHQKELVAIVKANPVLWYKKQKEYSGKNFNKELAWAAVAEMLKNISGSEAEMEFYKIRQRYGKERRKVIMSLKGKSGQGAQPTYVPTWELYELCDSFLREVVIPRKTTSNYMKILPPISASNKITIPPTVFKVLPPQNIKTPVTHRVITTAQIPSANWTSDFYASLSSDDTTSDSIILESPRIFQSPAQQTQAQFRSQTPSPSVTQIGPVSPSEETSAAQQILQKMSQATAKTVPSPDTFNKKKRKMDDDLTHAYLKQSEGLNNLAVQVSQALVAKQNPAPVPAAAPDPILGAIQMALIKMKDANKFQCMLDACSMHVLQYINEKYLKTDE